mgnify:CR=1 FL=1
MEALDYKHIASLVTATLSQNCTPPPIRDSIFTPTAI